MPGIGTTTAAFLPGSAGPWKCAAVTGPVRSRESHLPRQFLGRGVIAYVSGASAFAGIRRHLLGRCQIGRVRHHVGARRRGYYCTGRKRHPDKASRQKPALHDIPPCFQPSPRGRPDLVNLKTHFVNCHHAHRGARSRACVRIAKQGASNDLCIAGILRLVAADNKPDFQNGVLIRTDDTDAGRGAISSVPAAMRWFPFPRQRHKASRKWQASRAGHCWEHGEGASEPGVSLRPAQVAGSSLQARCWVLQRFTLIAGDRPP